MVDHGASGRVHDLRMELIHSGSSSWQFCAPEEVEYKIDEQSLDLDGLCEVFCRVTVWRMKDNGGAIPSKEKKLALILKLETDQMDRATPNSIPKAHTSCWAGQLCWKYFDLQDLVTLGLDTRPWFATPIQAAGHGNAQTSNITAKGNGGDEDYWAGFSSETDDSSLTSGSSDGRWNQSIPSDPALVARLRNTPLYRSKAPSVSSATNSDHSISAQPHETPLLGAGPRDLRARLSRTPLYKRAPSVDESPPALPHPPPGHIDLDRLLQAAQIVNLPAQIPHPPDHHQQPMQSSSLNTTEKDLRDKLVDSLRATFHLYRFCLQTSAAPSLDTSSSTSQLSPGESFLALAHRAVLLESDLSKPH
ncbi:uncharacterized protein VP01_2062g4 [Puccinia sorghi]|uniref:Uncharacterized protein n=1 Tax=Puccinia sorghi TaxID=27349 RepID=A0A0L6VCG8_9BASI|nr:uncharacterized protein VP01_2062g4 [Puccinia sorghi]